ncbi:hypothetical protein QUB68_15725 [Microcoleus sp. A006_D1]|uniref:hypothetical protein n=1 Tax=Microcoleus sp. A006_D1 TaxID=3055267 RepID=UPI002FD44513
MNPKGDNEQSNLLRELRILPTISEARLVQNRETRLPRAEALAVDKAQEVMNDLYREGAEYGDGSCAFMVLKEQFEGGAGNPPQSLKDSTLHATKCQQYIKGLRRHLAKLPSEAKQKIEQEIVKMEEALKWAEDYRNSDEPEIPRWAKPWKEQLGK